MNKTLPPFQPPSRPTQTQSSFPAYLKQFEDWTDKYTKYVLDYVTQMTAVVNTGAQGFAKEDVAIDTVVYITSYTTIMTGSGTISTINTSPDFSGQIHLIAQDGFDTDTAGNINAVVSVAAGASCLFDFNPVTEKWYANLGE